MQLCADPFRPFTNSNQAPVPVATCVQYFLIDTQAVIADEQPEAFARVVQFHFDVPGGRWQTVISSPVCSARAASPIFHALVR